MRPNRKTAAVRAACLLLIALLLLPVLGGCSGKTPEAGTGTIPATGAPTQPATDPATNPATDPESATDPGTETETKPVTEPLRLTSNRELTFAPLPDCKGFLYVENAECEAVADETYGYVARVTLTEMTKKLSVMLDYVGYLEQFGLSPMTPSASTHILCMTRDKKGETAGILCDYETAEDGTVRFVTMPLVNDRVRAGDWVDILYVRFADTPLEVMEVTNDRYVNPERTTLQVAGLKRSYTFLHFTDLHACACEGVEPADRLQYCQAREKGFASPEMTSAARMPYLFAYGQRIQADMLFLTGDIIDFPSDANLSLLKSCVRNSPVPSMYITGNHDWSFFDNYNSAYARQTYLPQLAEISGGNTAFHYVEYEDLIVAALDNAMDEVPGEALNGLRKLCQGTKPIILLMHIPMTVETLTQPTKNVWGRDICMGPGGVGYWIDTVYGLYQLVAIQETPIVAVVTGHVHFSHEDTLPNGVPQIVTGTASQGGLCRVITVEPKAD